MITLRQRMIELLREEELDAKDLSGLLSIREKDVYEHLPHVVRSLGASDEELVVTPYCCLKCDYVFKKRSRLDRPGRCPRCKDGHIRMATYMVR